MASKFRNIENLSNSNTDITSIPTKEEIKDRFYDLNDIITVNVDYRGWIHEVESYGPFKGVTTIRRVINMLNKDINVILEDKDLIKMRNSIVFYNEYFCPSEENVEGYKPALTAYTRICSAYDRMIGRVELDSTLKNPFYGDVLDGVEGCQDITSNEIDDAMSRYIAKQRAEESKLRSSSSRFKVKKEEEPIQIKTIHTIICENIPGGVDLDNFEFCYENVEFDPN